MKKIHFIKYTQKAACRGLAVLLSALLAGGIPMGVRANVIDEAIYTEDGLEDYAAEVAKRKKEPIQTNRIPSWPKGPAVGAAGAVVMDADSGVVLYGKNMEKHLYPASITKLMTALLAYENLRPDDTVTFSKNAVFSIERGSSHIGMDVGEEITVEQALYGLMVASANEVAIALGEKVSGSEEAFADLMNERARRLGCKNTNFVTLNGLHDAGHYTCAYDMALIGKEIFKHPDLLNYMSQSNYHFEASEKQKDDFWIGTTNDFLTGEIRDEDVIGGKTGYTDQARETLVTFAERDGVRLICVIMKEEPPNEYYDTIELLNYGFDNFKKVLIAEEEDKYTLSSPAFLTVGTDIFGKSSSTCSISKEASLMIPKDVSFRDLESEIISLSYTDPSKEKTRDDAPKSGEGQQDPSSPQEDAASTAMTAQEAAFADPDPSAGSKTDKKEDKKEDIPENDADDALLTEEPGTILPDGRLLLGVVRYSYNGYVLGSADVGFRPAEKKISSLSVKEAQEDAAQGATAAVAVDLPKGSDRSVQDQPAPEEVSGARAVFFNLVHTGSHGSVYLNILLLLPMVIAAAFLLCVLFFIHSFFVQLKRRRNAKRRRARSAASSRRPKK